MILGFHHACLIADDREEAIRLYAGLLGMTVGCTTYSPEKKRWKLQFSLNGTYLLEVFVFDDPIEARHAQASAGLDHISFLVEDVFSCVTRLSAEGITVSPVMIDEQTGRLYAFFYHPNGIKHELYQSSDFPEKEATAHV